MNIHGAVNIESLNIVTDFAKSVNKESSLRLFKKIEARHPLAQKIHIIVDNASYYISPMFSSMESTTLERIGKSGRLVRKAHHWVEQPTIHFLHAAGSYF